MHSTYADVFFTSAKYTNYDRKLQNYKSFYDTIMKG